MSALTYRDFCDRLTMEDILKAAGYRFNRKDGMRYPCYVAVDSLGQRIKGDKFIVMPDRKRCFQPPFQQVYNVVSFIREFPEKFTEYQMGMSTDKLVNLVCNRLLNTPMEEINESGFRNLYDNKPFDLSKFKIIPFDLNDWDNMRGFYPYFRARGIDMSSMRAFSRSFILTSKVTSEGKERINLSFPLRKPSTEEGSRVLGLELRSRPDKDGKTKFKGLAQGSEATTGLWMATPDTELWKRDLEDKRPMSVKFAAKDKSVNRGEVNQSNELGENVGSSISKISKEYRESVETSETREFEENREDNNSNATEEKSPTKLDKPNYILPPLPKNADIYWFESGYDAMAYYQLNRRKTDFGNAIFVSTSGNPSVRQFQAVMDHFPNSKHHLCFDNDMAGRMFTLNFLLQLKGEGFCTRMDKAKDLLVIYDAWKCESVWRIPASEFNIKELCQTLDIDPKTVIREVPSSGLKDWNEELLAIIAKRKQAKEQLSQQRQTASEQLKPNGKSEKLTPIPKTEIDNQQSRVPVKSVDLSDTETQTSEEQKASSFKLKF